MVYLALYKAKGNWVDYLVRFATRSRYSHCELVVKKSVFADGERIPEIVFDCYSSSPRDGGVRCKRMSLNESHWDLVPISHLSQADIELFFRFTKGKKYDLLGAIGTVLPCLHRANRYFCSEWAAACLGLSKPERYSPAKLAKFLNSRLR